MKLRTPLVAVAAAALVATTAAAPATAAPGPSARDLPAASASSAWLASQLVDGLLTGPFGNVDYGLTIDALLAMQASGDGALAESIATALDDDEQAVNFYSFAAFGEGLPGNGLEDRVAGATAKTLVAAQASGRDARSFGGADLVAETLSTVVTASDVAPGGRFAAGGRYDGNGVFAGDVGRVVDFGPSNSNNANTFGQTLATIGLARADALPRPVVDKLLWQQCSEGYFRIFYSVRSAGGTVTPTSCDQGKADGQSSPDRDSTGFGLSALLAAKRTGVSGLDGAIARAVTWLVSEQDAAGGWGGGVGTEAPNTNSTGLVVQALAEAGTPAAVVARGQAYLASAQATASADADTALADDIGAIAYTPAEYTAGRTEGITSTDTWVRATAQASLGLSQVGFSDLVGIPRTTRFAVTAPTAYVLRGRPVTVRATGLTAGETYRVTVAGSVVATGTAPAGGVVSRSVTVPAATAAGTRPVVVTGEHAGRSGAGSVRVLAATKLGVRLRAARVRVRGTQRITVRGLAAGEPATIRVRGRAMTGRANAAGVLVRTVTVRRPLGRAKVVVTGAFTVRKGTAAFRVVRR